MPYSIYEQQKINAARRRALADQIASQSGRYTQQQVAPGGLVVPLGLENLGAELGTAWMARRADRKAAEQEESAEKEHETALSQALAQYRGAVPDEEIGAESYNRIMNAPPGELAEPTYGETESQNRVLDEMLPREQIAQLMIEQQMQRDAPYTLAPGARRMQGSRVLGEAPAAPRTPEPLEDVVVDGQPRKVPRSQAAGMEPAYPPDRALVQTMGPDGQPILTPRADAAGAEGWKAPPKPMSPREANAAKGKLVTTNLLRQQLGNVRAAFEALKQAGGGTGPIQGRLPTQAGEAFDVAVNAMRDAITSLTRTPGVGAMSDFETRLNQAKIPNRALWHDESIEEQIRLIEQMVEAIDEGYQGMLQEAGVLEEVPGGPPGPEPGMGPPGGGEVPRFASEQEAEAAAAQGFLKSGDRVVIGGVSGTWQ